MRRFNYRCGMIVAIGVAPFSASYAHGDGFAGSGHKSDAPPGPAVPNVVNESYIIDDGSAEDDIGVTGSGSCDFIWLNSFPRQAGRERINQISIAYGSPFDFRSYNGLPVRIVLYGDATGGSPSDATLLYGFDATIANSNTDTYQSYAVPNVSVPSTFLVGVVAKNLAAGNSFLAGMDFTTPTFSNRSYGGYTLAGNTLDETNLGGVPNFSTMESVGLTGNWLVRANGVALPEPASLALLGVGFAATLRRRQRNPFGGRLSH